MGVGVGSGVGVSTTGVASGVDSRFRGNDGLAAVSGFPLPASTVVASGPLPATCAGVDPPPQAAANASITAKDNSTATRSAIPVKDAKGNMNGQPPGG